MTLEAEIDDWRLDPFLGTYSPKNISETQTVRQFACFGNRYGIQTEHSILFESPSSVVITGFNEVGFGTAPSINEFRVDYDPLKQDGTTITTVKYKNTGFIEFNSGQNGVSVTVAYKGTGGIVSLTNTNSFVSTLKNILNAALYKIINLANGEDLNDAVNRRQLLNSTALSALKIFNATTFSGSNNVQDICYSEFLGYYAAISSPTTANYVHYSLDGETWSNGTAAENNSWRGIASAEFLNLIIAVSVDGTNRIMKTSNLSTWNSVAAPEANQWGTVCVSESLGLVVAGSINGTNRVMYSSDGITFNSATFGAVFECSKIIWVEDWLLFVAVGYDGTSKNQVYTSANGTAWTLRYDVTGSRLTSVAYNEILGYAVAVAGSANWVKSEDGLTWETITPVVPSNVGAIISLGSLASFFVMTVTSTTDSYIWDGENEVALNHYNNATLYYPFWQDERGQLIISDSTTLKFTYPIGNIGDGFI